MTRKAARRHRRRGIGALFATVLVLVVGACGDDGTGPATLLVGTWNIVGFSDMGENAVTTGTWVFRADSTFAANGTVAFPGEPVDAFILAGSYTRAGNRLSLTVDGVASDWLMAEEGNRVTLTEDEPSPANVIVLEKP